MIPTYISDENEITFLFFFKLKNKNIDQVLFYDSNFFFFFFNRILRLLCLDSIELLWEALGFGNFFLDFIFTAPV